MLHLYRRENTVSRKDKLPADAGDGQTGARGSKNHTSDALDGQQKTDDLLSESDLPAAGRLSSTQPAPLRQLAFQEDVTFEHGEGHHEAGKRDVELYIRTYNTFLRSSGEIRLKALVQAHYTIASSLHPEARSPYPDMSAFIYSVLRLPSSIIHCNLVLLGQSEEVFQQQGFHVDGWEAVTASARRRKWFYDGKETLAVYVASVSDTDDIVPVLVAFQIEWNKIYYLLKADATTMQLLEIRMDRTSPVFAEITKVLRERLHIQPDDWRRLELIWGDRLWENLLMIGRNRKSFLLRMLGGSHVGFVRSTRKWWVPVKQLLTDTLGIQDKPVYFVSSNTHSLVNLMSGCVLNREEELTQYALSGQDPYLADECRKIQQGTVPGNWQNFLYFAAREWARTPAGKEFVRNRAREEQERGIWHVGARHGLEIDAQVFELSKLRQVEIDPRCRMLGMDNLARSQAIIINIDYPLGMAAYRMLREIMENVSQIRGIYVLGKAATLNGSIGDVLISNVVLDEHSQNVYWLDNCFIAQDVQPYLIYGSV